MLAVVQVEADEGGQVDLVRVRAGVLVGGQGSGWAEGSGQGCHPDEGGQAYLRVDVVPVALVHAALGCDGLGQVDLEEAEPLALVPDGAGVEAGTDDDHLARPAVGAAGRGEEGLGTLVEPLGARLLGLGLGLGIGEPLGARLPRGEGDAGETRGVRGRVRARARVRARVRGTVRGRLCVRVLTLTLTLTHPNPNPYPNYLITLSL